MLLLAAGCGAAAAQADGAAAPKIDSSPREVAVACKSIRTAAQLNAIRNNLAGSYCLAADIDAGTIANFVPIGSDTTPFTGRLFGNGRVIRNLTINSSAGTVGLFGSVFRTVIQDVGLVNVDIIGTADDAYVGGLVGYVFPNADLSEIRRVHVSGRVVATGGSSPAAGGIVGYTEGLALADSWSSAGVGGAYYTGGAIGVADGGTISRVYATGPVTCTGCYAGGLIAYGYATNVTLSHATGKVIGGTAGGLAGDSINSTIQRSHAFGAVTADNYVGGLVGHLNGGTLAEVYAVGRVAGGATTFIGGLVGGADATPTVTNAYWDINTSTQAASAVGTGYTTAQLRAALPPGFTNSWAITATRSYPFLNDADIDFSSPLATLVGGSAIYTFLPIGQRVQSEYLGKPAHTDEASLAAVYTMIARAVGITDKVPLLQDVKIDKYFWRDATQTAPFTGPVTEYASLGRFAALGPNTAMTNANVIGQLNARRLVILRGTYTKSGGGTTKHWMLATLYTKNPNNTAAAVVAHDPWTGTQVLIDPKTKKVIAPSNFPLSSFTVDGYRSVIVPAE